MKFPDLTQHRVWFLVIISAIALFLVSRSNLLREEPLFELFERVEYDDVSYDFPMQKMFNERLAKGELALWNPYQSAGNPTIGTLEARLLYPPRLIFTLLLGVEHGQWIEILFHIALGVFGTFGMLRSLRVKSGPAAVGAIAVLLSAEFLGSSYSHNVLATIAWVPVCVLSVRRLSIHGNLWRGLWVGVTFSMLVYAGYPQYGYYTLHACAIICFFSIPLRTRSVVRIPRHLLGPLVLSLILFTLLAGPQVLSSAEFFAQGLRGEVGVTKEQFQNLGGRPFWTLIPLVFTGEKAYPEAWRVLAGHQTTYIISFIVFSGFLFGLTQARYRKVSTVMLLVALPFALLAMGTASPFADLIYDYYPLGSTFRVPLRAKAILLFIAAFGISLCASGLVQIISQWRKRSGIQNDLGSIVVLVIICASLLPGKYFRPQVFLQISPYAMDVAQSMGSILPPGSRTRSINITGFATEPYKKSGMLAQRGSLSDYEPANTYRSYLLARVLSPELRNQNPGWVWLGNTEISFATLADPNVIRLLRAASVGWVLGDAVFWRDVDPQLKARIARMDSVQMAGSIPDSRMIRFLAREVDPAVLAIAQANPLPLYQVFRLNDPLPRAYTSNRIELSLNAKDSALKLQNSSDPASTTILELPAGVTHELYAIHPTDHMKPARFEVDLPEQIILHTETVAESFLVLNDKFFPGWECTVDGNKTPIFPANVLFRAIRLPAGTHRVEFTYRPGVLFAACMVAASTHLFILLVSFFWFFKRRHSSKKQLPEGT
ncbi:MAG: hypothetical protein JNM27_00430 [Leptospirales bacterium]|nr:hypothetical protein [Leptospirales bacterium]